MWRFLYGKDAILQPHSTHFLSYLVSRTSNILPQPSKGKEVAPDPESQILPLTYEVVSRNEDCPIMHGTAVTAEPGSCHCRSRVISFMCHVGVRWSPPQYQGPWIMATKCTSPESGRKGNDFWFIICLILYWLYILFDYFLYHLSLFFLCLCTEESVTWFLTMCKSFRVFF